jgi:hypothetical protein
VGCEKDRAKRLNKVKGGSYKQPGPRNSSGLVVKSQ